MEQHLIPLTSPSLWKEALLDIPHAFGHTWESCYAMHLTSGYPTFLYFLEENEIKVICPIIERKFQGYIDIFTPYGFSGFVGNQDFPAFDQHWKEFAQSQEYVCGYIGLNPILGNESYCHSSDFYPYNTLYVLDLRLSIVDMFNKMSQNRKRQLKNFKDQIKNIISDKDILRPFFLTHYHAFFNQKDASPVYNFSIETLSYLISLENVLLVGQVDNGNVVAVSMFAYTPFGAEYLFNISLPEGKMHTVPLLWFGINCLKTLNIPYLNLGGGVKEGDSIAQFKQRFGAQEYRLSSLKQVYNKEVYTALCHETKNDPDYKEGYFPPYRQS